MMWLCRLATFVIHTVLRESIALLILSRDIAIIRDGDGINPETLRTVLYVLIFRPFHEPEIVDLV